MGKVNAKYQNNFNKEKYYLSDPFKYYKGGDVTIIQKTDLLTMVGITPKQLPRYSVLFTSLSAFAFSSFFNN